MAVSAVTRWKQCWAKINKLSTLPSDDPRVGKGHAWVVKFSASTDAPPTRSEWRTLVQELKIPSKLSTACVAAAATNHHLILAADAALAALKKLLEMAQLAAAQAGRAANSVQAVWQQVEQSGFVAQLPGLITGVAQDLQALTASVSAGSNADEAAANLRYSVSSSHSLLQLVLHLMHLGSPHTPVLQLTLSLAPGVMLLVRRAMQYFSAQCDLSEGQRWLVDWSSPTGALVKACCIVITAVAFTLTDDEGVANGVDQWYSRPEAAELLASPHFQPCLAIMAVVGVAAATGTFESKPAAQGSSRGSRSSSSGASSSRGSRSNSRATPQVTTSQFVFTPCLEKLCATLAVDGSAVMCVAMMLRMQRRAAAEGSFVLAQDCLPHIARLYMHAHLSRCWHQQAADQQSEIQQLALLMPCLWLRWGVSSSSEALGQQAMTMSMMAKVGTVAYNSYADLQQRAGHPLTATAQQQQQPQTAPCLPAEVLEELLPQVIELLRAVLAQQQPAEVQPLQQLQNRMGVSELLRVLNLLLQYSLPQAAAAATSAAAQRAQDTAASASSSSLAGPGAATAAASTLQVAQENMMDILGVLESSVRHLSSAAAAAGSDVAVPEGLVHVLASLMLLSSPNLGSDCSNSARWCSLLASLLKYCSGHGCLESAAGHLVGADSAIHVAGLAALCMINPRVPAAVSATQAGTELTTTSTSAGKAGGGSSSSSSSVPTHCQTAEAHHSADTASSVSTLLPSLFVCGRVCLQLAQQLTAEGAAATTAAAAGAVVVLCKSLTYTLMPWLSTPSVAQQLSALGYQPQELLGSVQQLKEALDEITAAEGTSDTPQSLTTLAHELTQVGTQLCSVAVPSMCNYPACSNMDGPSELSLVTRRGCRCGGCLTASYCSKSCQVAHWKKGHKPVCKALAAAAAAAAAAANKEEEATAA